MFCCDRRNYVVDRVCMVVASFLDPLIMREENDIIIGKKEDDKFNVFFSRTS